MRSRVVPATSVLFRELDGEAVLLELESGKYFGLDEVGTRFWNAFVQEPSLEAVVRSLLAEFEVEEAVLRQDLAEFVQTLVASRLVVVDDG